ncbi:MAG: alanine racemase [Flavobacteriaceae bacterium]|nr:alanine racemase [Flavobacteriaceae bacterium]
MSKTQETVLEINLKYLTHNFDYVKSKLADTTKFMAVVKAFAYGNAADAIANHLQNIGVDYFAVAYTQEGVALRDAGVTKPILVLHPQPVNFKLLIAYGLEPNLYSTKVLDGFIALAEDQNQTDYPVHLKFNTGLNRLGFTENDVDAVISKLKATNAVNIASVFSHLVASEDTDAYDFTTTQIQTFKSICARVSKQLNYAFLRHLCNTSGILNYPEAHFDMVRSGIGVYGFGNSDKENNNLIPIASLKSIISQIHTINAGESVGYNRAYKSDSVRTIATIPIGHADGISRTYGNGKGFVSIHNKKAPIIGNVCMDMIMVDVTGINCKESDEVILFDRKYTAEQLAKTTGTIAYELITAISQRVKRRIVK